jgi:hypothetical protein
MMNWKPRVRSESAADGPSATASRPAIASGQTSNALVKPETVSMPAA